MENNVMRGIRVCDGYLVCLDLCVDISGNDARNRRVVERSKSQSIGRGVKDPNTSQWRRGPMGRTAMLVKQFSLTRLNFGQGVGKGTSYRQSALIPTCDAPDSIVH